MNFSRRRSGLHVRWSDRAARTEGQLRQHRRDFVIARIYFEDAPIPLPRFGRIAVSASDVTKVAERNQILRIKRERTPECHSSFVQSSGLGKCLPIHDPAVQRNRLFANVGFAKRERLLEVAGLAVLVGERGIVAARILVVTFLEFVNARQGAHKMVGVRVGAGPRTSTEVQDGPDSRLQYRSAIVS